jgi:hypothetical protein
MPGLESSHLLVDGQQSTFVGLIAQDDEVIE